MDNFNVKINYLYNSGYAIETENNFLVFDYYLDTTSEGERSLSNGVVGAQELKIDKNVIVFSSHSHSDHYNPIIFNWKKTRADINYILSSDIETDEHFDTLHKISAYENLNINDVSIKAFGSTDIGISFLVKVDGISIFHAGDLNWWHWWDEPEEANINAEKMFKHEIEKLKGNNIDIAFFPVDHRLKTYYYYGGEYFIQELAPKTLIPMHFREDFEITSKFANRFANGATRIIEIQSRGQEIIL
jgi:L-ascorbate metabolism protein UlaG (beta-lactamase superfamily)